MRWTRKADENAEAMREERKDDERLREAVAIRQHELERRLRLVVAQSKIMKGLR